jgi:hypothetical protein
MNYPPLTAKELAEVKRLLKKSQIPELEYREYEYEVRYEKEMRELELQKDKITVIITRSGSQLGYQRIETLI